MWENTWRGNSPPSSGSCPSSSFLWRWQSQPSRRGGTCKSIVENFNQAPLLIWTQSTYPSEPAALLTDHLHLSTSTKYRSFIERPNYKLLTDKY